jgi:acyl-coenzyme A synthetase/AMP-(fatty) acid ligase
MQPDKLRLNAQIEMRAKPLKTLPQISITPELPKTDSLRRYLKDVARKSEQ